MNTGQLGIQVSATGESLNVSILMHTYVIMVNVICLTSNLICYNNCSILSDILIDLKVVYIYEVHIKSLFDQHA